MRYALLAAAAALTLFTGCRESADEPAADNAAVQNVPVLPITDEQVTGALAPAPASKEDALKLMHERHEGMEDIGDAFKVLGRETKADAPNLEVVQASAATIARLAPQASSWFPAGTGPDVGKTRAKPEIWQKPDDFNAKMRAFQAAARSFDATAKSGDVAAIKAGFGEFGKTCKACHDLYRAPEDNR
jgi:cytochrome c556